MSTLKTIQELVDAQYKSLIGSIIPVYYSSYHTFSGDLVETFNYESIRSIKHIEMNATILAYDVVTIQISNEDWVSAIELTVEVKINNKLKKVSLEPIY